MAGFGSSPKHDAADVLFHVVNNCCLRELPTIFTTNQPLSEWGEGVARRRPLEVAAIIGRVLERGRFIGLNGASGRIRHLKLETPCPGSTGRLRISGRSGSEFPEPTTFTQHYRKRTQEPGQRQPDCVRQAGWTMTLQGLRIQWLVAISSYNPSVCVRPLRIRRREKQQYRDCCRVFAASPPKSPLKAGIPPR